MWMVPSYLLSPATPSNPLTCSTPLNPFEVTADFTYQAGCQTISFFNESTAGSDIQYLWIFPDSSSTVENPVWTATGAGPYAVTLIVTNIVLQSSDTFMVNIALDNPFASYASLADQVLCNEGTVTLDATYSNATYLWDNNSSIAKRVINNGGTYWVALSIDGCTLLDSVTVNEIHAEQDIIQTHCAGESVTIHGEVFDETHPNGMVTVPGADPSGCDSLLNVQLTFLAKSTSQFADTICNGDTYTFANQNLSLAGTYLDTLISFTGCDSIVTLDLAVTPRGIDDHALSDCIGNQVLLTPGTPGTTYAWDSGSQNDSILVTDPGTYVVSVSDARGCIISEETFTVTFGALGLSIVCCSSTSLFG
jgi:hypothetical protein